MTTVSKLLDGWVLRSGVNSFLNNFVAVNLFVSVWGGDVSVFKRALVAVLMESVGVFWCGVGESQSVRRFIMRRFLLLLWLLSLTDFLITPLYLINPYWYFILFLILLDGVYELLIMTCLNEVREVLIPDANGRNSYLPRVGKVRGAASVCGAVATMLLPVGEWGGLWMFGAIMLCIAVTAYAMHVIMSRTLSYMRDNGLSFPCERVD